MKNYKVTLDKISIPVSISSDTEVKLPYTSGIEMPIQINAEVQKSVNIYKNTLKVVIDI